MMTNEEKMQNTALIKAAEIAFETEYHLNAPMMDEECACEIASKVYREICGEYPDLNGQFGFGFDEDTVKEILDGTYTDNHIY